MPMDIFRKAVAAAIDYDSPMTIGGGEPTLHPDLLSMLGIASLVSEEPLFMVTNGTCPEALWRILMQAQDKGSVSVRVSSDFWHDLSILKPWVCRDADRLKLWWGEPSDGRRTLVRMGRAKRNWARLMRDCELSGINVQVEEASCTARVSPDGRVWSDVPGCGPVGTIDDPGALGRAFEAISKYGERL